MDIEAHSLQVLAEASDNLTVELISPNTPVHRRRAGSITDWDDAKRLPNSVMREEKGGKKVVRMWSQKKRGMASLWRKDEIVVFERVLNSRARRGTYIAEGRTTPESLQKRTEDISDLPVFPAFRQSGARVIKATLSPTRKPPKVVAKPDISFSRIELCSPKSPLIRRSPSPLPPARGGSSFKRPYSRTAVP